MYRETTNNHNGVIRSQNPASGDNVGTETVDVRSASSTKMTQVDSSISRGGSNSAALASQGVSTSNVSNTSTTTSAATTASMSGNSNSNSNTNIAAPTAASATIQVQTILNEADNAAGTTKPMTLPPGTGTGTGTAISGTEILVTGNAGFPNLQWIQNGIPGTGITVVATTTGRNHNSSNGGSNNATVSVIDNQLVSNGVHGIPNLIQNHGLSEALFGTSNAATPASAAASAIPYANTNNVFGNPLANVNLNNINMNLNPYLLATASVPVAPGPIAAGTVAAAPAAWNANTNANVNVNANANANANAAGPAPASASTDANNGNGYGNGSHSNSAPSGSHAAILQQNATIMQQNAAALQHLQQTNNFLAANPGAATLGMLAPIVNMNMNLAANPQNTSMAPAAASPVQFLAASTGAAPSLASWTNPSNTLFHSSFQAGAHHAPSLSTLSDGTPTPPLPAPAPHQAQQAHTVLGCVPASQGDSNMDSVNNILRTAIMLQNTGLPLFQQPLIPTASNGAGGYMVVSGSSGSNAPIHGNNGNHATSLNDASDRSSGDRKSHLEGPISTYLGSTNGSGAAAAANAAASVLPVASLNLPLQQQQQQLNSPLTFSVGVNSNGNGNHAGSILGSTSFSATHNANNTNGNHNRLKMAAAAAVASMNPGLAALQQHQKQQQQQSPMQPSLQSHQTVYSQPHATQSSHLQTQADPTTAGTPPKNQQQPQTQKPSRKQSSGQCRPLYLDHDSNCLTAYQCFLRKQIELFEVGHDEMRGTAQGRNTPLQYGQVGIRCRHCAHLTKAARPRGGVYYSRTIDGVYQVAQNMSKLHFMKACTLIPENTKSQLISLQSVSSRASGGKEYWAEGLRVLGLVEVGGVLRFSSNPSTPSNPATSTTSSSQITKPHH